MKRGKGLTLMLMSFLGLKLQLLLNLQLTLTCPRLGRCRNSGKPKASGLRPPFFGLLFFGGAKKSEWLPGHPRQGTTQ
jgi:hypothetical protein